MKPWRPYWKHLEDVQQILLRDAGPCPFELNQAVEWIANLRFLEVINCDGEIKTWIQYFSSELEIPIGQGAQRWQAILRVECGLTFCRGLLWKRKDFDWSKTTKEIYSWLLIDLWYKDAMFWASRMFSRDKSRQFWHRMRSKEIFGLKPALEESSTIRPRLSWMLIRGILKKCVF